MTTITRDLAIRLKIRDQDYLDCFIKQETKTFNIKYVEMIEGRSYLGFDELTITPRDARIYLMNYMPYYLKDKKGNYIVVDIEDFLQHRSHLRSHFSGPFVGRAASEACDNK